MGGWRSTAAAMAALALAGCAMQAAGRAPRHTGMNRDPSPADVSVLGIEEVEGRVRSLDSSRGLLIVEGRDREVILEAAAETTVFVDGGLGGMADLQEGIAVRASFEERDGRRIARWIEVPRPEEADARKKRLTPATKEVAR